MASGKILDQGASTLISTEVTAIPAGYHFVVWLLLFLYLAIAVFFVMAGFPPFIWLILVLQVALMIFFTKRAVDGLSGDIKELLDRLT